MATAEKQRPRLKNLDDLFLLAQDKTPQEKPVNEVVTLNKQFQAAASINRLIPFEGHPFHLYEGERLDDMVASIQKNGILNPLLVREKNADLEILSGHNRVNAAKIAGLTAVPVIILKDISDEAAWIYVIETNLMQRSFSDMSHSEKAAVIAMHHSKLFSQGKRNDILEELKSLENPHKEAEDGTSSQVAKKLTSIEKIGVQYSLSKDTIARYLRVNRLIPTLKSMLDGGIIAFIPSVTLSFLKEREQSEVAHCVELNGFSVDMKKADTLRQYSEDGKLDEDSIFLILNGELGQKPKPNRTPVVKVNKAVYTRYFKPEQSDKEVQDIVEKALELYFSNNEMH